MIVTEPSASGKKAPAEADSPQAIFASLFIR